MSISLSKGQKVDLSKTSPGLTKAIIGLGWDTNRYNGGFDFDLDAAAFLLGPDGKVTKDSDFIFYNNLQHETGFITHTGDNLTGAGDGDDETIIVDFEKAPANIDKVSFTVTIHEAAARNQNFGQVSNAYVRLIDASTNAELLRYDLTEDFSVETAIVVCEIYNHNGSWKFGAVGSGFSGGLHALCTNFGLDVK